MSIEHSQPKDGDRAAGNRFEIVVRGYDKRQVEGYVARLREQLSAAQAELRDARRDLAAARDDSVALRRELENRRPHEQISARMAEILRLAQEEAEQERNRAAEQAAGILERTQTEALQVLQDAQSTAAEMTRDTAKSCEDQLTEARTNATQLIETAQQQAAATLTEARERSHRVLTDVDRRSRQIMALQQRRLAAVLAAHQDLVQRLEVTDRLIRERLDQEREQGDPAAAVEPEVLPTLGPAIEWVTPGAPRRDAEQQPEGTDNDTIDVRHPESSRSHAEAAVAGTTSATSPGTAGQSSRVQDREASHPTNGGQGIASDPETVALPSGGDAPASGVRSARN